VREAIARGDSYQANYTFRLHARVPPEESTALYDTLIRDQRPPYAAFADIGHTQLLSLSPELFFRLDGRRIVTRPMKGTAPRGLWEDDDRTQSAWLNASEKNRAENVMIVDLSRNDVSRIADVGSVRVNELFVVERYPSLFQMVSEVEAQIGPDIGLADIFTALFPAGSVTGAPKISSMKLIASIEGTPRGIYCGAVGYATPTGQAVFNVAIRTATIDAATGDAIYGVGGGITWDSAPADEYAEAIAKSVCLVPREPFDLIETMRFDGMNYLRLDRHLRRLRGSAQYFDFDYKAKSIAQALADHADLHRNASRRVRLRMTAAGRISIESRALESFAPGLKSVVLASSPVSRRDPFLFHKTTRRTVYDRHRAQHADALDVLLWNEDEEITEFTIGNVVVELDGRKWTPPRAAGLLAGIFREELLETGQVHERTITKGDIHTSSRLWLVNSLREWVEVRLSSA
jgi:para-aminobenzoate synthetase/4-amino-4-deoxychorismate lyase